MKIILVLSVVFVAALLIAAKEGQKNAAVKAYQKGCANGIAIVLETMGAQPAWDKINSYCIKQSETMADPRPDGTK